MPYKVTCLYRVELTESDFKYPIWDQYVVGQCTVVVHIGEKLR